MPRFAKTHPVRHAATGIDSTIAALRERKLMERAPTADERRSIAATKADVSLGQQIREELARLEGQP